MSAAETIAAYLQDQQLEHERFDDHSFAVALPGEKRLKTACLLTVGAHALEIEAFVMRKPDENHEKLYAFLLQRNARMYAVAWSMDGAGDIYLTGRVPLSAVTPDELAPYWDGAKLALPLVSRINGRELGRPNAGVDLDFDFPTLIAHAAKSRRLAAGTIVGSGTVSNRDSAGGPGKPIAEGGVGYSCLAELRTVETINHGKPVTPFLKHGDTVRIWAEDDKHHPIFGVIEQTVG